ncbi:hypothetical protein GCM10022403_094940 [Streptomyces coacervatus]|uniref:Uncharacterized protein n=1 Tax=Streptomyces coacervatus TaxID=647381 RepID=A0ABP7JMI1_9ACTN
MNSNTPRGESGTRAYFDGGVIRNHLGCCRLAAPTGHKGCSGVEARTAEACRVECLNPGWNQRG